MGAASTPAKAASATPNAVGQRHHARHVDAEGAHHRRVFGRRAQVGAELRLLDDQPRAEADHDRGDDHPAAIDRQEHEAEVPGAGELLRDGVGHARRAEIVLEQALEDQRQAEGEKQAVQRIEAAEALQEQPLHHSSDQMVLSALYLAQLRIC